MLFYKAWRESQIRFLLSCAAITGLSICFVLFRSQGGGITDHPVSYIEYIWRIVYKGYLRQLFVMLALLLGVGGLLRERDYGTIGFTLALPVSRWRLLLARAAVGLAEVTALSFLPALLIPQSSALVGEFYPQPQAFQFGILWSTIGAFVFMLGFLASNLFGGEFTAPVVAFLGLMLYSIVADLPVFERFGMDVHDIMSGIDMPFFQAKQALIVGPLPWTTLTVILLAALGGIVLSAHITARKDF